MREIPVIELLSWMYPACLGAVLTSIPTYHAMSQCGQQCNRKQTFAIACGIAAPVSQVRKNATIRERYEPGKTFPPLPPFAPDAVPMNKFTRDVNSTAFACANNVARQNEIQDTESAIADVWTPWRIDRGFYIFLQRWKARRNVLDEYRFT
jgi:hypothetical protein